MTTEQSTHTGTALFRHTVRPEWGTAMLVVEEPGKRRYQFTDGKLRTFKEGYYELFEQVEIEASEGARLLSNLQTLAGNATWGNQPESRTATKTESFSLPEQITIFKQIFERGFQDTDYEADVRGCSEDGGKGTRHDVIIACRTLLSKETLGQAIEDERWKEIHKTAVTVAGSTNIPSSGSDLRLLRQLDEDKCEGFAKALFFLLHSDEAYSLRFTRWVEYLASAGVKPTWPMTTVLPALAFPGEHIAIKPSVFRQEARVVMSGMEYTPTPNANDYERYQRMGKKISQTLVTNDLQPRDMMDVYDFIWLTLRPKGKKLIKDLRERS